MLLEDVIQFLEHVPPFQLLANRELQRAAAGMSLEFYPKDMIILKQEGT